MRRKLIKPSETSPFLGIATGKQAAAKAAAAIKLKEAETAAALALEQAKRDTLALQLAQAQAGFTPEADKAAAELQKTEAAASTSKTMYFIIGFAVVAVMVGLYFITKKR